MSESTYFLDLGKSTAIQLINNRLSNMDTSLRRFPQTGYQILRSSTITAYSDAEFNVQDQILETGSNVNTGDDAGVFITGPGTTNWTNSSVTMKYTKYSTGKFDAEFNINLSGNRTVGWSDTNYQYWQYYFAIPVWLIKNVDEASVSIESYTGVSSCKLQWRKSNTWYISQQTGDNVHRYIRLSPATTTSAGAINITDCKIYLTGSYDMNLDNA